MIEFVNLTPHAIVFRMPDGTDRNFPPSGTVARVAEVAKDGGHIDGMPVAFKSYGEIESLPDPVKGTVYIVSALVLSALRAKEASEHYLTGRGGRSDVVAPGTGPTDNPVREDGKIVAVTRWNR